MDDVLDWYDAKDYKPRVVCEVELSNSERMEAVFVCGSWETIDGQEIYPIRFRILRMAVTVGLYKL